MKVTLDIDEVLLSRAKGRAKLTGRPLRTLVEDGLRQVLAAHATPKKYELPDLSVGSPEGRDPLKACSWQDMRELIYGVREAR